MGSMGGMGIGWLPDRGMKSAKTATFAGQKKPPVDTVKGARATARDTAATAYKIGESSTAVVTWGMSNSMEATAYAVRGVDKALGGYPSRGVSNLMYYNVLPVGSAVTGGAIGFLIGGVVGAPIMLFFTGAAVGLGGYVGSQVTGPIGNFAYAVLDTINPVNLARFFFPDGPPKLPDFDGLRMPDFDNMLAEAVGAVQGALGLGGLETSAGSVASSVKTAVYVLVLVGGVWVVYKVFVR
jgi:hypothetical protein